MLSGHRDKSLSPYSFANPDGIPGRWVPGFKISDPWASTPGFQLPPDVSFEKQRLSNAWAYVFRHRLLGEIGRILLQELDDGRCHISCEVVGDPSDPMTTQRAAIFKPLGLELTRQMEAVGQNSRRRRIGRSAAAPSGNQGSDREQAHSL